MKRKLFTLDGIMISFVSCMLYASIDVVCGVLGLPLLASVALSFVLGAGLEGALNMSRASFRSWSASTCSRR